MIPILNAAETIEEQLQALARQDFAGVWELVICDNGSTDGTKEIISKWAGHFPRFAVIDASRATGANFARNCGVDASESEFLLFCDADDVASESWISEMVTALDKYEVVGGSLDWKLLNDPQVIRWRGERSQEHLPVSLHFLPYVESANFGIRRSSFKNLGGWDESFSTPAGDDVDLCWRAQLSGRELGYARKAVMHYRLRNDLLNTLKQAFIYGRADVRLFVSFRKRGVPRSNVKGALATWAWIVMNFYRVFLPDAQRGGYVWIAAYRSGRLAGSLKYRTLFL